MAREHTEVSLVQRISKNQEVYFFGKSCTRDFGAPVCYPSTLIDVSNTALAIKFLLKTICMICEGYRTHRGVTGPMNFKKPGNFFSEFRAPGVLEPLAAIQAL